MRAGHCLCGAVTFTVSSESLNTSLCHCPSCKRAAGAPMVAWAMFERGAVAFTGTPLTSFVSSEGVRRGFCGRCGTAVSYEADFMEGLIDLTVASFDDPAGLPPTMHIFTRHREPWMTGTDLLESFEDLPPQ